MDRQHLAREWIHAFEEDRDGNEVFRPAGFALPPARGRNSINLRKSRGGRTMPGADDRPQFTSGEWQIGKDGKTLQFNPGEEGAGPVVYEVISVEADRMVLRRRQHKE